MEKKENQRVALTKRLLRSALLRLLETKELDKINVSELCREADINRATFYKHYTSPADVLNDVTLNLVNQLRSIRGNDERPPATRQTMEDICVYLHENRDLVRLLIKCRTDADLLNLIEDVNKVYWEQYQRSEYAGSMDSDRFLLISTFFSTGGYYLIRQWLMTDMALSPVEVADLVFRIITKDNS